MIRVVLAAALALGGPGSTGDLSADELSEQAIEEFNGKNYEEAVRLFEEAYEKDPQPNYLYNIGRVYEESGDFAKAVELYQDFVSKPGVDLQARENAIARLKVLKDALEQLEEDEEPVPEPVLEPEPEPEPTGPDKDELRADRVRKVRIAGYSLMGVGGVSLVVGAVFGGLALGKKNDADDAAFVDSAMGLRDDAKTQARVADAMYITGGVLAGAGLVMVLATLGKKNRRAGKTAWTPMVGRGQLGLSMGRRF